MNLLFGADLFGQIKDINAPLEPIEIIEEEDRFSVEFYKAQLDTASTPIKLHIYNRIFWLTYMNNPEQALHVVEKGMELAKKTGNRAAEYGFLTCYGAYFGVQGDAKKSLSYQLEALGVAEELDPKYEAVSNYDVAEAYFSKANTRLSDYYLNKAYEFAKRESYHWLFAKCLYLKAEIARKDGARYKAVEYSEKSIYVFDSIENIFSIALPIKLLASLQFSMKAYGQSLATLGKLDSVLAISENSMIRKEGEVLKGRIYMVLGQNEKAEKSLLNAWEMPLPLEYKSSVITHLAYYYLNQKQSEKLRDFLNELSADVEASGSLKVQEAFCHAKAGLFESLSVFDSALIYERKAHVQYKSWSDQERQNELDGLDIIYESERQSQENKILKKDLTISEQIFQRKILYFSLAILIIVALFSIGAFILYRRYNKLLLEKNKQINLQKEGLKKANQQLLEQNDKLKSLNKEKDDAIKVVTHDLKAPLNRVEGLLNVLKLMVDKNSEEASYIKMINQVILEGSNTVNRLIDIKNIESGEVKLISTAFDLGRFLEERITCFEEVAQEKQIRLNLHGPKEPVEINNDGYYLSKIVDNLLSNAIKFTFPGTQVKVMYRLEQDKVLVEFEDKGPGVKPEERGKLFKKYQRLSSRQTGRESSTGLGLAVVMGIINKMEGQVSFRPANLEGTGAVFCITFPQTVENTEIAQKQTD